MTFEMSRKAGRLSFRILGTVLLAMLGATTTLCISANADAPQSVTSKIVGTANAFLATLNDKQRSAAVYKFSDDQQRAKWSNFPTGFVPRGGLKLGDLSESQRSAAMTLVASALSQRGYEKVQQIMDGDENLKQNDRNPDMFGKVFTTFPFLARRLKKIPGCCSLAGIIWPSTSPSQASRVFSPQA